jgi:putative transposase
MVPEIVTTDGLASYASALTVLGLADRHRPGRLRENNRAENSHLPIRRRAQKSVGGGDYCGLIGRVGLSPLSRS